MFWYNLVDEAWMTGRRSDDGPRQVGLLDVLLDADRFEDLVMDLPTQIPAVLRQVLLPVVVDALGAPADRRDWRQRFAQGHFSEAERERLRIYLGEHHERFDLFSQTFPFGQVAGLRTTKGETKGSATLVANAASGNNVPLFASRTEADPLELTPAQAVHWLLHTLCWDTAAIKTGAVDDPQAKAGKTTGNPTGPLGQLGVVMPVGQTLYETLLLNMPFTPAARLGVPQWKRPAATPAWTTRAADGLLDLWTWQSRRVRLIPHDTQDGVRVARVVVSAGDRLSMVPEWEPHTAWNLAPVGKKGTEKKAAKGHRHPRRHVAGKAAWRGLEAMLTPGRDNNAVETSFLLDQIAELQDSGAIPADYPLQVHTYGMIYGTQSAVVEDILCDAIALPILSLVADTDTRDMVLEVAEQAEKLARAVNNLSADLRRAAGADPIPWNEGQRPGELVLHGLDPLVRRLLAGVRAAGGDEEVLQRGQLAWEKLAWRTTRDVAEKVFATTPPGAFVGREVKQTKQGKNNEKAVTYSLGTAEHNFLRQLRAVLPRAADARTTEAAARRASDAAQPATMTGA
ncbi:type I-E CRISPR-associated protein Cse1/CasA [Longispora fulva]|uniref:CRISPR system Cascade subunit CasA n=1 Tax=Longispora fulva TaxID=619741 RepID=A0A8J7KK64_9ACTN|nr:type I-E CRISPR-associated protein Cse1/CasA [Longispora fulva]MBG6136311.1 CRISPR system Cascade subunit CasA [Longispora fulva]